MISVLRMKETDSLLKETYGDYWYHLYICDDIRRVERRNWWPMHIIRMSQSRAIELRVWDVDVTHPSKELLTLTLYNAALGPSYPSLHDSVKLQGKSQVTIDDIPRLLARYYGRPDPAKPRPLWQYVTIVVAASIVLVSGCGYAYVPLRR